MFRKLFNSEYVIKKVVNGYKICKKFTFFGISFHDTLDMCYDKKSLDESLRLFGIVPNECKNYPEN